MASTIIVDDRSNAYEKPSWTLGGNRQAIQGSDFIILDPSNRIDDSPNVVDFDIQSEGGAILFGPNTRFHIRGSFVQKAAADTEWIAMKATEAAKVLLQPNWFEHLVKSVDVFHQNQRLSTSTESRFIAPHLNSFFYYYMDSVQKQILFPQQCHPARCMPAAPNSWASNVPAYTNYASKAFKDGEIDFHWIPYMVFPWFQHSNYLVGDSVPKLLPMQNLGKLQVRITFHDKLDSIFRKAAGNATQYRFKFEMIQLIVEEARLSPAYERSLLSKREIVYPGVTKLMLAESVIESSPSFKTKFQDIYLPESIFIFCLNKNVLSGTYSFADATNVNIFEPHSIKSVDPSFGGKNFTRKGPSLGKIDDDRLDPKRLVDMLDSPIFGVNVDPTKINCEDLRNGAANTLFPHIYIPFMQYGSRDRRRITPFLDDGTCLGKKADLEIEIKFDKTGSTKNVVYIIIACYTDVCAILDLKTKHFSSLYLNYMN